MTQPTSDEPTDDPARDGSDLCLPCGLCCQGIWFRVTIVNPAEVQQIRQLGLIVEEKDDRAFFRQPCRLFEDNRCSAYPGRPGTCVDYRCKLLQDYLHGALTVDEALHKIKKVRKVLSEFRSLTGSVVAFQEVLREVAQYYESRDATAPSAPFALKPELLLNTAALLGLYRHHFAHGQIPAQVDYSREQTRR